MREFISEKTYFAALCVIMLGGILVAGLAPFGSPVNAAKRLDKENGLVWDGYAIAVSGAPILDHLPKDPSFSIELRLRPAEVKRTRTLISFHTQQRPNWFRLRQSNADADVSTTEGDKRAFADAKDVFEQGQFMQLALTCGPQGTKFYANGRLVANHPDTEISSHVLTGTMTLGNSVTEHDSWQGEILGLAVFNRELAVDRVQRHFETWNYHGLPEIEAGEHAVALYLFDEDSGRLLKNQIRPQSSLTIPEKYRLSQPVFLALPWREFGAEWSYLRDVLINIAGFVPFGFALRSYLSLTAGRAWPSAGAVIAGSAVSMLIEITQSLLPTRDSSLTDVMTNSLGNWVGAMIAVQFSEKA